MKKNNGITMVALIITVVILIKVLILLYIPKVRMLQIVLKV